MPKNKDVSQYDSNGHWIEERGRIKGAIRRVFRLSPQMRDVLDSAKVYLPPDIKKDGTPGKKPRVRYKCAICTELFPQKHVQVDHINPVVPFWETESKMPFNEWVVVIARGIFCKKDNLQVLCSTPMKLNDGKSSCHKKKTDEENFIRRELAKVLNLKDHTGEEIDALVIKARNSYTDYLKEKEEANARKKERSAKRARNSRANKAD
jgi:hypothetical protein